ncbi:hypothetical protein C8Q80DRAFT_600234 [Daedaleopsis nitida]|nr:hypothetical protein C8Q80DRAFT_600234 [Daedaleopsis nitida]
MSYSHLPYMAAMICPSPPPQNASNRPGTLRTAISTRHPLLEPRPSQNTTGSQRELCQTLAERPRHHAKTAENVLRSSVLGICGTSVHTRRVSLPLLPVPRVAFWLVAPPAPRSMRAKCRVVTSTRSSLLTVGDAHGPSSRGTNSSAPSSLLPRPHPPSIIHAQLLYCFYMCMSSDPTHSLTAPFPPNLHQPHPSLVRTRFSRTSIGSACTPNLTQCLILRRVDRRRGTPIGSECATILAQPPTNSFTGRMAATHTIRSRGTKRRGPRSTNALEISVDILKVQGIRSHTAGELQHRGSKLPADPRRTRIT